ncbi:pentatricopeptide repeat-containing protein At1g63400-like [Prosopis cineraria]|uniref:pentatricopeptide repeat-containing protein At1g63400-like n=1 Tax=Prosopis cineraria TaxID=364024 RepID=UPI00240FA5BA|nr:pentatricopeptide repeat-containing protein At1g63400-like [Prosopis cineraria]
MAKMKYFAAAILLFAQSELNGFTRNLVTLNILMNCYYHIGRMNSAFSTLGKFFKLGYHPSVVDNLTVLKDISPNVYTSNILVDALCKEGGIIKVGAIFARMMKIDKKLNVVTYSALIDGHCLTNYIVTAKGVFNKMIKGGLEHNLFSYSILINAYFKMKMVDEAMDLFKELHYRNLIPDLENLVIYEMRDRGHHPNIITYTILLDAFCKRGYLDKAITLFKKFGNQEFQPTMETYTAPIDGLCKGGQLDDAWKIFHYLVAKGYRLDVHVYNVMIYGLCKNGLLDEAEALLYSIKRMVASLIL